MKKTMKIEGMMCAHCVKHVTDALNAIDGVTVESVDLKKKTAVVEAADDISDEAFSELVADAPVLCRLIYCNIKMQYPQRKLAVYVAVSRHDSLTIRFHQVWTGEPPYYDPEDFSSGDERVFSVID